MINVLVLLMWLVILVILHILIIQFLRIKQLMTELIQELKVRNATPAPVPILEEEPEKETFKEIEGEAPAVNDMEDELYNYLTKNANEKLSTIPGVIDPFDSTNFDNAFNGNGMGDSSYAMYE